jgi:hypothetical protein
VEKKINIKSEVYKISKYDSFGSSNRKRLCIMNITYQDMEIEEDELNWNSIQICELINKKIRKIIGIYNISDQKLYNLLGNHFFNQYYKDFGDIYDSFFLNNNQQFLIKFIENKIMQFPKNLDFDLDDTDEYEEYMTLSQFKTKLGLLICQFISNCKDNIFIKRKIITELKSLFSIIKDENLTYYEIIRLVIFTYHEKIDNKSSTNIELILLSMLNNNSPYKIAYDFNIEEINYLDEFSPLFQAYLQLDSYKCFNYIHNRISHTFSLELPFMVKYQLLTTYEKFFYIKSDEDTELALIDNRTKITIINGISLFGKDHKKVISINNLNESKNYAMPLSMSFRHEKGGHYKYLLKNRDSISPLIYYKGLKIEVETNYNKRNIIGESGVMIENFISGNKKIINELSTKLTYGDLLSREYFLGKDFKKLENEVIKRMEESTEKNKEQIKEKYESSHKIKSLDDIEILKELSSGFKIGDVILNVNILKNNITFPANRMKNVYKERYEYIQKKINYIKNIKKNNDYK